jgi:hypothetical protein
MPACEMCGANTLLMVNVGFAAARPEYTYRCPQGHITKIDFRSPPQNEGIPASSDMVDMPATPPSPPPPPDGGVAGSPFESWPG